jgi:ATP-dependent helicase YprA (DUF1998 family)
VFNQAKLKTANDFKQGSVRLLLATEAFGMGTDVRDIRRVVHIGPPKCREGKIYFMIQLHVNVFELANNKHMST